MAEEVRGARIAVIATDGFEESELVEPVRSLKSQGAQIVIIAPHRGEIQGFRHHDKSIRIPVDRPLAEVSPDEFDGVLLPGGALNADEIRIVPELKDFLRRFSESGKPLAAICHAPWELVSAGLVKGRRLASYKTLQDDIHNAGGEWVDEEVVVDQNWVTSRGPKDIPAFIREFQNLLSQHLHGSQRVA